MKESRHIHLFDRIAPVYALFFRKQIKNFREVIGKNPDCFGAESSRILDIGCGTGALVYVLSELGHQVEGVDASSRMIAQARHFNKDNNAVFRVGDVIDLYDPAGDLARYEKKYDLVVASFVMHGLQLEQRMAIYGAMKLLARKKVIIMDYNQRKNIFVSLIEWLERGDYFNFVKTIEQEMKNTFPVVKIINVGKRSAWYICECDPRS